MHPPTFPTPHDEAADPAASVWVSASAGTGKTTALTGRVIELLKAGAAPEQVMCLTYTKAAAAEMRRKVLDRLSKNLLDPAGGAPELQRLFVRLLEKAESLSVHTIHGLCQKLLQLFPVEAGVAAGFDLLDDITAREFLRDARLALVMGEQREEIKAALGRLTTAMGDTRLAELLRDVTAADSGVPEWLERTGDIEAEVFGALGLHPSDTADGERAALLDLPPARLETLLALAQAWEEKGGKDEQKRAPELRAWLALPNAGRGRRLDRFLQCFLTQKHTPIVRLLTNDVIRDFPHLQAFALQEQQACAQYAARDAALRLARQSADLLLVCQGVLQLYRDRKEAAAVLDFADLLHRAWGLLKNADLTPWVLYKLDRDLRHLLVDEAQDTNSFQWDLMETLTGEFFSGEGQVSGPRTLCVVGDEKQSIFGFQGAEPGVFVSKRADYRARMAAAGLPFREVGLHASYRSTAPVLQLVDAVFANAEAREAVQRTAEPIAHGVTRTGVPGYVEVWPLFGGEEEEGAAPQEPGWQLPLGRDYQPSPAERAARAVASTIRGWLDEGRLLASAGRPIRPGDILILLRSRSRMIHHLTAELQRARVPTSGVDRFDLCSHLAAQDLLALAQFALNPLDDLNLAAVLKSPFAGLDEAALLTLCAGRGEPLWRRLTADPAHGQAAAWLSAVREAAQGAPPLAFFHRVLDRLDGRRRLLSRLGYGAVDVLETFLEQVMQYERLHTPTLQGLVHWMAQGTVEVVRDATQPGDYVRIMTIHASKGLQAPIVFLPDAGPAGGRGKTLVWNEDGGREVCYLPTGIAPLPEALQEWKAARKRREEAESLRLLYVALTRAADCLIVGGAAPKRESKKEKTAAGISWHQRIADACGELEGAERFTSPWFAEGAEGWRLTNAPWEAFCSRVEAPEPVAPQPAAPQPATPEPAAPLPAFARSPLEGEAPGAWVRPSQTAAAFVSAAPQEGRWRGQAIHRLLQYLPGLAPAGRREAGERILAHQFAAVAEAARRRWLDEALGVMERPDLAALFAPPSQAEVAIVGSHDGAMISAQIDRLLAGAEEVVCLEYKTTPFVPRAPEGVDAAHLRQVRWYRAILARRYPGRRVRTLLLYTAAPALVEIPA